jgi:tetratricopeptide (TPR) repeat protein
MRDFLGAIEHYNHVLKVNRKSFQALLHRGIAFHSHGYHESAIGDYNRALALNPANSIVLQNRAKAFAAQKEWNRAIADIDAIKESERDAGVFALLSSCYSATSQKENALKAIDASLQLDGLSLHALVSYLLLMPDMRVRAIRFSQFPICRSARPIFWKICIHCNGQR